MGVCCRRGNELPRRAFESLLGIIKFSRLLVGKFAITSSVTVVPLILDHFELLEGASRRFSVKDKLYSSKDATSFLENAVGYSIAILFFINSN